MSEFTHAVIDLDPIKYAVSSVGEKKTIKAVHRQSGDEYDCKTRTAFWGHHKKKEGGLLAEMNAKLPEDARRLPEEFDIIDIVTPEPLSFVLHTAKAFTDDILTASGCKTYHALLGKGDSWRVGASTLMEYKGNRKDLTKPCHYDDVVHYLQRKYSAEMVEGLEVDDRLVVDTYGRPNAFAIAKEKDIYSSAMHFFDTSKPDLGIQNGNQFGKLYLNDKGDVKGIGRMHWMWQVCSGDDADNYKANCFSDVPWAAKSAYNALKDCKDDRQLFQAAVDIFQTLYPEPKKVTGWRGDEFEIDWLYVFQEMATMAWMLRKPDDKVDIKRTIERLGVEVK